jgi:hypothetical protein
LWLPFIKLETATPTEITKARIVNGKGILSDAIDLHCIKVLS